MTPRSLGAKALQGLNALRATMTSCVMVDVRATPFSDSQRSQRAHDRFCHVASAFFIRHGRGLPPAPPVGDATLSVSGLRRKTTTTFYLSPLHKAFSLFLALRPLRQWLSCTRMHFVEEHGGTM